MTMPTSRAHYKTSSSVDFKMRLRYGISTVHQNNNFGLRIEVFLTFYDFSENNHSYLEHNLDVMLSSSITL